VTANAACPADRRHSGVCKTPQLTTYLGAASSCASAGGRLATLGELSAFRSGPGASEKGIERSSDWDAGSGTLWCVGDKGAISGTALQSQAHALSKLKAELRCVTYLAN
jgi:hypothetical protein